MLCAALASFTAEARGINFHLFLPGDAGAELIAPPTVTPWRSLNARLEGPADVQLTIFTELDKSGSDHDDTNTG